MSEVLRYFPVSGRLVLKDRGDGHVIFDTDDEFLIVHPSDVRTGSQVVPARTAFSSGKDGSQVVVDIETDYFLATLAIPNARVVRGMMRSTWASNPEPGNNLWRQASGTHLDILDGVSFTSSPQSDLSGYDRVATMGGYTFMIDASGNLIMRERIVMRARDPGGPPTTFNRARQQATISFRLLIGFFLGAPAPPGGGGPITGGVITDVGAWRVHRFTASGTFNVTPAAGSKDIEYLIIAGGGGGGGGDGTSFTDSAQGGGGGAGGFRTGTIPAVGVGAYPVLVGSGGAGGAPGLTNNGGFNGSASSWNGIVSAGGGGGGGGGDAIDAANTGGSGGGGSRKSISGAAGTAGQGNAGGNGRANVGNEGGGGGGGAGGAGQSSPSADNGGAGGPGLTSSISGSSVAYAGGGGGGGHSPGSPGAGGSGGGGAATFSGPGVAGAANTGGGGGAAGSGTASGGNGGSGIVILRYLI